MPNIGTVLREEISRLSRRESRSQVNATKKATAQHRGDIAALKRQVVQLQRQVALLSRKVLGAPPAVSSDPTAKRVRFAAGTMVDADTLAEIHHKSHDECFIANSVKTVVSVEPQ